MIVVLTVGELEILDRQDPETDADGGWQSLLVGLQTKVSRHSLRLDLDEQDLERIPRYAFDYGNGGWESRLRGIFERSLGSMLGRD
jgi:hypothetical protein